MTTTKVKRQGFGGAYDLEEAVKDVLNELVDDHATVRTWLVESDADQDAMNNLLHMKTQPDGVLSGSYAFSAGGAVTIAATGWVRYRIGGVEYTAEMPATITLEDLGDVTQNKYGSWRIEIDKLGAITAKMSPTVGGYTTEQIAMLAMGGLAPTANTVVLGYLTIVKTGSAFNVGTDNLNVATSTAAFYYERGPRKMISGLNAALSVASSLNAGQVHLTRGTVDVNRNGLKKAQIAGSATQALTDADTITTLKYGAVLVLTDLAGTGIVTLNAAGTPGATLMAYNSAALAKAALDLVVDRLPSVFVPISYIAVYNGTAGTWTFKTTLWDVALGVATITDAGVAGWDRTVTTGFNSHQINPPSIPASLTAPVVAALTALELELV